MTYKLCILRLSSIGDVCHLAAVVKVIQEQKPKIEITWIIGKAEYALLKGMKNIEFIVFDKTTGLKAYQKLRNFLKERQFDNLFHMQRAFRTSIANLCIKSKIKTGWDRERAREGQWLFNNRKVEAQKHPHVIDGFFAFAQTIGIKRHKQLSWDIPIPTKDLEWAQKQLGKNDKEHLSATDTPKTLVINAAASDNIRNWSIESYGEIAKSMMKEHDWNVVLTGGPSSNETELADKINKYCNNKLLNLTGKTSLKQLLAVIKLADIILAPDTGPLHMAATVGTKAVGLYAHSNPKRTGPILWNKKKSALVVSIYEEQIIKEYGKPSSKLKWGKRARSKTAMNEISVDEVWAAIKTLSEHMLY